MRRWDRFSISSIQPADAGRNLSVFVAVDLSDPSWTFPRWFQSCSITVDTRLNASLIATSLRQDSPSDPRQLVGERNCQNITMQSPRCGGEPRSKAVFHPTCRSQEDGAGALDEEHA